MTKKHKIEAVLYHLFVCLFGLLMIYPVLWMISGSLKNNTEILNGGMNLIPPAWRVENFANGWEGIRRNQLRHLLLQLIFRSRCFYPCHGTVVSLCGLCIFEGEIQRKKYLVYGHDLHHDDTDTDHSGAAVHHLQ